MREGKRLNWRLLGLLFVGTCLIEVSGVLAGRRSALSLMCNVVGLWFVLYDLEITK